MFYYVYVHMCVYVYITAHAFVNKRKALAYRRVNTKQRADDIFCMNVCVFFIFYTCVRVRAFSLLWQLFLCSCSPFCVFFRVVTVIFVSPLLIMYVAIAITIIMPVNMSSANNHILKWHFVKKKNFLRKFNSVIESDGLNGRGRAKERVSVMVGIVLFL